MTRKPPPRRRTDFSHVTICDTVRRQLRVDYDQLGGWRAVGEKYGVKAGTVQRVATSAYEPRDPAIRLALGLPVTAPAPICLDCGQVHVASACTARKPAGTNGVMPVTVWAHGVRSGAVVRARSRRCARRRCRVHFVPAHGERYCSDACRERVRACRRKQKRTKLVRGRKRMRR